MNVLEARNLEKKRQEGAQYTLRIPEFAIKAREIVAITGPSGCGKSTTLDLLGMALKPDKAAHFAINTPQGSSDIASMWREGRSSELARARRSYMGYVLQTGQLYPFLSVRENIELGALLGNTGSSQAALNAANLMERLEIGHLQNVKPHRLSVGERQRAAIARALAPRPLVVLADEPTAALDPVLARIVMRLFLDVISDFETSVVLVSHDIALVREFNFREIPVVVQRQTEGIIATLDTTYDAENC